MSKAKRFFAAVLSVILATICALGVFIGSSYTFIAEASPITAFSVDQKDGSVKKAKQTITGKINSKGKNAKVTYEVFSEVDEGKLSFAGEADVSGGSFNIDDIKLKPNANKIIVTAQTPDGKTEVKTLNINYDSSSIKNAKVNNISKVQDDSGLLYVNNNLLVYFEDNISDERRQEIIDTVGGTCTGYVNGINMWQVEVAPASYNSLSKTADRLTAFDEVFYAGCNLAQAAVPMVTEVTPSDPWGGDNSWNEYNPQGNNWSADAIQAPSAWGYDWAFSHINVGIVDAGVQNNHEDLAGKVFFPDAASQAENNANSNHGTHVAGIIGATPNNSKGVTGILWDTFMYCVNWDVAGGTDANLFAGLTETVQAGAKVVNFSLGLGQDIEGLSNVNDIITDYAHQSEAVMTPLLNAGYDFIVCQSAGNGNLQHYSKDAIYNGYFCSVTYNNLQGGTAMTQKINGRIIIVGSAERIGILNFRQAQTSNAGSQVDICAPGASVYSCIAGNTYAYLSGTSMASPEVAGVAALTWSVNPALTGAEVRSIVIDPNNSPYTVSDNTSLYHPLTNSYRMVNALRSVEAAMATKTADYSAVNTAVAAANALNSTLFTPESWANLTETVNTVDYNLLYKDQPQINAYAQAVNNAIAALVNITVSYTVEYRLNSANGSKLTADKISAGQVTKTVNETAAALSGYSPMNETISLQLAMENNLIIFVYIDKPVYCMDIHTYKTVNGALVPVCAAKAGDEITVTVTPSTNFYCGASQYVVMYDKNFYSIVGTNTTAFTFNPESTYYANTVTSVSGLTTSPAAAWPASFTGGESSLYNFTRTTFSSANGSYPTVINDGKWLFSFKLQVNAGASGSGRIFADNRWTRNLTNLAGEQYFYCCPNETVPSISGTAKMDFFPCLPLADRYVSLGNSVNFDLNGGAGTVPAAQGGTAGTAVALPSQNDISKQHYNFLGWASTQTAEQALDSYVIPADDATLYAVWSAVPVTLAAKSTSTAVVNQSSGFIYGLEQGITKDIFESSFTDIGGNGRLEYSYASGENLGTGTKVDLINNTTQEVTATYIIIIFGDVNGDSVIDTNDTDRIIDIGNYVLPPWNPVTDAAFILAGDLFHDGVVDENDADVMVDVQNYRIGLEQSTGMVTF